MLPITRHAYGSVAVVVSPLIALMKNQIDLLRNFVRKNTLHTFNSSLSKPEQDEVKRSL